MENIQSLIFQSFNQFILGFGACFGLCVFLGRVILAKHDERHTDAEKRIEILHEQNDNLRNRLTALESAHNERGGKQCQTKLTATSKRSTRK